MFLENYKRALGVVLKKPIMLWGLSLLMGILSIVGNVLTASILFLNLAVGYLFTCGSVKLYMDGLNGKEVNSKQLFAAFNKNCVKTAGAMAWQNLWSVIWGFVPVVGVIKAYSYRFVPYIIMTHPEISAFDALKISMKMTDGKKLQMWLADLVYTATIALVFFVLIMLGLIPILGIIFRLALTVAMLALLLFGGIFTGLYQASFFNEEEVAQYIDTREAFEVAQ